MRGSLPVVTCRLSNRLHFLIPHYKYSQCVGDVKEIWPLKCKDCVKFLPLCVKILPNKNIFRWVKEIPKTYLCYPSYTPKTFITIDNKYTCSYKHTTLPHIKTSIITHLYPSLGINIYKSHLTNTFHCDIVVIDEYNGFDGFDE